MASADVGGNTISPVRIHGEHAPGGSPLILDSPHSFRDWPAGAVPCAAPEAALLTAWDAWVDEIWRRAARGRAPLLAAGFPRTWLDVNRARDDVDEALLDGPWPGGANPSPACRRGMGLVRRDALPGVPMYDGPLAVAEVQARIAHAYDPYHAALDRLVEVARARTGVACLIDCHSMKSRGNAMNEDAGRPRPDVVVSDRDGVSADPLLTGFVADRLGALGYDVRINDPYRGGEIVRRLGRPAQGCHAIQIELNRRLYMDEARLERHAGFHSLVAALHTLVGELIAALDGALGRQLRPRGGSPR